MGSRLLTVYSDGVLVPSLLSRLTEPVAKRWPVTAFARLSGSLAARDRAGNFSLTSSGALRWRPGPGARINWYRNASAESSAFIPLGYNATVSRTQDQAHHGSWSFKIVTNGMGDDGTSPIFQVGAAPGQVWTYSAWVLVPAGIAFTAHVSEHNADQEFLASGATGYIGTGNWQFVTHTRTLSHPNVHLVGGHVRVNESTPVTFYLDENLLEQASSPGPYFDASTVPNGAWLDPYTGQLGPAYNSPSVEWAQAWVEDGTTNEIRDPVFGNSTITAHWGTVGAGTTLARTTAYCVPYGGVAAAQVTCDGSVAGQGLALLPAVAPAAASGQTRTVQVAARGSGTVKIQIVGLDSSNAVTETFESSAITLSNSWPAFPDIPTLTATFANAGTVKYVVRLVTTTAQAVTFYAGYVGAEQKSYATSPCHGSMGTGYSWSGTAHASSSTRALARVFMANAAHLDASMQNGFTIVLWVTRIALPASNPRNIWCANDSANWPAGPAILLLTDGTLWIAPRGNGAGGVPTPVVANGELHCCVGRWNGQRWDGFLDGVFLGSSSGPVPQVGIDTYNAVVFEAAGPILFFNRPLTDAEIARLFRLGPAGVNYDSIRAA